MGSSTGVPVPDPDPNFRAKPKSGAPKTYREGDSELGTSGDLPRTSTEGDDAASRLNNADETSFKKPVNGDEGADADKSKKKSPGVPRAEENEGTDGVRRGPALISVDEKVAWRAAPARSRMTVKTQPATARLVRLPAYPKSEWQPVDADKKLAKK